MSDDLPIRKSNPVLGKSIKWINGTPVPVYTPPITPDSISDLILSNTQEPYEPKRDARGKILPEEEKHEGKTKLEVAVDRNMDKAADGDGEALDRVLDRTIGKPVQPIKSTNLTMNYQDFLATQTKEPTQEELEEIGATVVDVTPVQEDEEDDLAGL